MSARFPVRHWRSLAGGSLCVLASAVILGCSGGKTDSGPVATTAGTPPTAPTDGASEVTANAEPTVSAGLATNDPRTKWIGDIPYDVFFDRPLDVVRDQAPVGTGGTQEPAPAVDSGTNQPPTDGAPMPADTTASAGDGGEIDWPSVVSAELLSEVVTDIRNRLTKNLQTLATYNGSWEEIALDGHTMAALAAVIEKHPDAVSWKEKAKYVRDLGYEIYIRADGTGRSAYTPTQQAFESAVTILDGGPPPDMEADDLSSFADVVDRSVLMQQYDKSFDWLKTDINTETRLKEDYERVERVASMLAAFGTVMLDEGYDFTDEPDYQTFAHDFIAGAHEMVAASTVPAGQSPDYEKFQAGRNALYTSCTVCHQKYRTTDAGF